MEGYFWIYCNSWQSNFGMMLDAAVHTNEEVHGKTIKSLTVSLFSISFTALITFLCCLLELALSLIISLIMRKDLDYEKWHQLSMKHFTFRRSLKWILTGIMHEQLYHCMVMVSACRRNHVNVCSHLFNGSFVWHRAILPSKNYAKFPKYSISNGKKKLNNYTYMNISLIYCSQILLSLYVSQGTYSCISRQLQK